MIMNGEIMMKERYINPLLEILSVESEDILTASVISLQDSGDPISISINDFTA